MFLSWKAFLFLESVSQSVIHGCDSDDWPGPLSDSKDHWKSAACLARGHSAATAQPGEWRDQEAWRQKPSSRTCVPRNPAPTPVCPQHVAGRIRADGQHAFHSPFTPRDPNPAVWRWRQLHPEQLIKQTRARVPFGSCTYFRNNQGPRKPSLMHWSHMLPTYPAPEEEAKSSREAGKTTQNK